MVTTLFMVITRTGLGAGAPPIPPAAKIIGTLFQEEVPKQEPGAAVLVARGDRVIYQGARGRASLELKVALHPGQVFRIGSITKTLTAATVLKLVSIGEVSLDAPLSTYLPTFPGGEKISVAELLDHTSGISDAWEANPCETLDTTKLVNLIQAQAPDFKPGTEWRYSNSGYMLLGAIIEAVTKKPWDIAMRDLVLSPLGMTQTGRFGDAEVVPGHAEGYSRSPSGAIIRAPYASMSGPSAAGALSSTTRDLFRFMRALTGGRLLRPDLYQAMTTAKATALGRSVPYGYGVMLGQVRGEPVIEHNGGIEGFAAHFTYFPKQDVTVIVLANSDAGLHPRSLAHRFGAAAIGKPYMTFRPSDLSAESLQSLAGSYRPGPASVRTLYVQDGKLFVQRDGGPGRQLLATREGFLYWPGDETDYFKVVRDREGRVQGLDFFADGMAPAKHEPRMR